MREIAMTIRRGPGLLEGILQVQMVGGTQLPERFGDSTDRLSNI